MLNQSDPDCNVSRAATAPPLPHLPPLRPDSKPLPDAADRQTVGYPGDVGTGNRSFEPDDNDHRVRTHQNWIIYDVHKMF